jgi:hypothetical protein
MATAASQIWGELPQCLEGKEGREEGDGAFRSKEELVVGVAVAKGLSSGLFIG